MLLELTGRKTILLLLEHAGRGTMPLLLKALSPITQRSH